MEITVLAILAAFTFLLYYLTHNSYTEDHPNLRTIELRLLTGIFMIIFSISLLSITYLKSNGSPSGLTVYVFLKEDWQKGLFLTFVLFGFMQIGFALLDAIEYRSYKKSIADADDSIDRGMTVEFERMN